MPQDDYSEKTIGEFTYRVRKLDPYVHMDLEHDLLESFLPSIGGVVTAAMGVSGGVDSILDGMESKDAAQLGGQLQLSISDIFAKLTKARQKEWFAMMANVSCVSGAEPDQWPELGNKATFVEHFRGRGGAMYQWVIFAIGSQHDDFLGQADGAINRFVQALRGMVSKYQATLPDMPNAGDSSTAE